MLKYFEKGIFLSLEEIATGKGSNTFPAEKLFEHHPPEPAASRNLMNHGVHADNFICFCFKCIYMYLSMTYILGQNVPIHEMNFVAMTIAEDKGL